MQNLNFSTSSESPKNLDQVDRIFVKIVTFPFPTELYIYVPVVMKIFKYGKYWNLKSIENVLYYH